MMVTQLKNAIHELRRLRAIESQVDDEYFHRQLVDLLENDIRRYRSEQTFTVYFLKGLHEFDTHYESLEDIELALDDWCADDLLDDGIPITIELKRMTGRELGRLEAYED